MAEHFIHVHADDGVKVMSFKGVSVPRVGESMKLKSPQQKIDGEWVVYSVLWMVTNRNQGTQKFSTEAQAEVWVRRPTAKRRWPAVVLVLLLLIAGASLGAYLRGVVEIGWL